ncbi:DUF1697 domain-containing protein [Micromonospora endolithica]|uniref:DUF1697 domain-containing protein n=1 Tax=Micromonospora endolithica TaxID=230091 RepID=A0A3A9ZK68_9ACTN|nr:DUF1697 domain-containing protein [Micromonospora endolithica]RKN48722.1 DUF1697 domain-containing protein [Micromonospora endolithica]
MARYAVLLRGINLGKARRVGMADLRALLTQEGYGNVATLLQSGNVVLDADLPPAELGPAIERAIETRFGFPVGVILRSRDELARVVASNPLAAVADDGAKYVVSFLARPLDGPIEDALAGVELGADRYVVDGAEMYAWCPGGLSDSPLMKALGKIKNGPPATVRNWNTVEKLLAAMG